MSHEYNPGRDADRPGVYEIRIRGHPDHGRAAWFEGLTVSLEDNGDSVLAGVIIDQAALHGWLRKIRDLGMPLISVIRLTTTDPD